jgi:anti-sigma factor RsiW
MMRKLEPDTLVAYLDRELDAGARQEVESALAADPGLRARLAELLHVDAVLEAAFDPILTEPLPALSTGIQLRAARPVPRPVTARPMARLAWAAGIGGLIVGFAAAEVGPALLSADPPMAVAAIQAELPEVLESEVSGTTVAFSDPVQGISGTVRPVSTFLNADGSYCRAYEASASHEDGTLTSRGIACRDQAGHWLTRVQVNAA